MWEKNLAKIWLKMTKKILSGALPSRRERGSLKKCFEWVKHYFFKKNLIRDVWLIEKQVRSIEPSRGLLKFFKMILIDRKSDWINRNSGKNSFFEKITWFLKTYLKALNIRNKNAWVWDEMFFQNTSFKPNFSKI